MSNSHTVRQIETGLPGPRNPGPGILTIDGLGVDGLTAFLGRLGLGIARVADDTAIPGSFWGAEEAGLRGDTLYVRADTPVHSALHETGHYVCMDAARRAALDTNAGGGYDEENAVCFWQIIACDALAGITRDRMCADMDAWGYTFRLGSAAAWFAHDAEDARAWLDNHGLIDAAGGIRYVLRR